MKKEIKQISWFDDHFYKVGDEYFPSVTTKLQAESKPFLAKWRGDIGNREADLKMFEAANRGSRIHHSWYLMTTGGIVIYNPFERPNYSNEELAVFTEEYQGNFIILENQGEMYDMFKLQKWHEEVNPDVVANEMIVYSEKNKEAGQLDKLMNIEEGKYSIAGSKPLHIPKGLYVVDLKTGSIPDSAFMQLAAYSYAYQEMSGKKIEGGIVIHTGATTKNGIAGLTTKIRTMDEMKEDYLDYRAVAEVWDRRFSNKKPKVFDFPSLIKL